MSIDLLDIKMTNGRWEFDASGDVVLIRGAERVRQQLEFHMSLWAGEWFLDPSFGVPYNPQVLGKLGGNNLTLDAVIGVLREQILSVDGVTGIQSFDYSFDAAARRLIVNVEAISEFGIVTYTNAASVTPGSDTSTDTPAPLTWKPINLYLDQLDPRIEIVPATNSPSQFYRDFNSQLATATGAEWPLWYAEGKIVGRQAPFQPADNAWPNFLTLAGSKGVAADLVSGKPSPDNNDGALLFRPTLDKTRHTFESLPIRTAGASITSGAVGLLIKAAGITRARIRVLARDTSATNPAADKVFAAVDVNLETGSIVTAPTSSGIPQGASLLALRYFGSGWWRFSINYTYSGLLTPASTQILLAVDAINSAGNLTFEGDAMSGLLLWGGVSNAVTVGNVPFAPQTRMEMPQLWIRREEGARSVKIYFGGTSANGTTPAPVVLNFVNPATPDAVGVQRVRFQASSLNWLWGATFITHMEYQEYF